MPLVTPTPIVEAPDPPDKSDKATFNTRATAWAQYQKGDLKTSLDLLNNTVYNNAVEGLAALEAIIDEAGDEADASATSALESATLASAAGLSAIAAAASAASALNAPGTSATSTTSVSVGLGTKAFTIQTGKLFSIGQFMVAASTADPTDYMVGQVTAHDSGTGALTLNVTKAEGSGTIASWTLSLTGEPATALAAPSYLNQASDINLTVADMGTVLLSSTQAVSCYTPDATTLGDVRLLAIKNTGLYGILLFDNAGGVLTELAPNSGAIIWCYDTSSAAGLWAATADFGDFFGQETVYSSVSIDYGRICTLDANKVLVVYRYNSASMRARTFTLSGASITAGVESTVYAASTTSFAIVQSDTDKAIFSYTKADGTGEAVVISASGGNLSLGAPFVFESATDTTVLGLVAFDTDKFVTTYRSSAGNGYALVLSVSGTSISAPGSRQSLGVGIQVVAMGLFDTNKIAASYYAGGVGYCYCLSISGSAISAGPTTSLGNMVVRAFANVTTNKVGLIVNDIALNLPKVLVASASGTSVSLGATLTLNSTAASALGIALIGPDELLLHYTVTSGFVNYLTRVAVDGTNVLSASIPVIANSGITGYGIATPSPGKAFYTSQQTSSQYGTVYPYFKGGLQ